mmetsp:Transcript_38145/g.108068  ORF Transcript_38145/g.108068 Transcript_38145/m.108068 type:complete len:388 (+) Transcript_38145:67-1230(+)
MATEHILQLEDLARRYDAQVLREYLLDQEGLNGARGALELSRSLRGDSSVAVEDSGEAGQGTLSEVYDLRLRCFGRLRLLLWLNFLAYWSTVAYCGYACYLRTLIYGVKATPPLEAWLLGVFVLGTQGTLEFAASVCLTRPARATEARSSGFQAWDGAAWLVGLGARLSVLLDVQCLALMHRGSAVLFLISLTTFTFAIGLCVVVVQARMLVGLCCSRDHFTYDKPDLFFKGRDAHGMLEGTPIAASAPGVVVDSQGGEPDVGRGGGGGGGGSGGGGGARGVPVNTIKMANCAHFSDLGMLHSVLMRLYVPIDCKETQEFIVSASSFSRCFCEDVVQCSVKFFFLMDCGVNPLVMVSLFVSAMQGIASCLYSSTPSWDFRIPEDAEV